MADSASKKLHFDVTFVGLRAQATAVGFIQLTRELSLAGVIDQAAVDRIKAAIVGELSLNCPRSIPIRKYIGDMEQRLDRLFAGQEPVGLTPQIAVTGPDCEEESQA